MGIFLSLSTGIGAGIASIAGSFLSIAGGLSVCLGLSPLMLAMGGLSGFVLAAAWAMLFLEPEPPKSSVEIELNNRWVQIV